MFKLKGSVCNFCALIHFNQKILNLFYMLILVSLSQLWFSVVVSYNQEDCTS